MRKLVFGIGCCVVIAALSSVVHGIGPAPQAVEQWSNEGVLDEKLAPWIEFLNNGGCAPATVSPLPLRMARGLATADAPDTMYIPVVLVDFPDYKWDQYSYSVNGTTVLTGGYNATPDEFHDLLFSRRCEPGNPPNGSFTDFYFEATNGKLVIIGDIFGWHTAPNDYEYYVQGDAHGLYGSGGLLAREAAMLADTAGGADFSKYDNNNNGIVEGLTIIHAGPGAETGAYGIWSHRSVFGPAVVTDGVTISDYNINPEQLWGGLSTIGVFCHEFGHSLRLPDLGVGLWSLMAVGAWNGNSGDQPAQFDAWCRYQLNLENNTDVFGDVIIVEENMAQVEIPAATTTPVAYLLRDRNDPAANDYWFIENRQREGFDSSLPGEGLLIWHWDRGATSFSPNDPRPRLSLEQADGLIQLQVDGGNYGDTGDPFPGTTDNREFSAFTTPSAVNWDETIVSQISVDRISNSGATMYADLSVEYNQARVALAETVDSAFFSDALPGGDGDGVPEAGETISLNLAFRNIARPAGFGLVTVVSSHPGIVLSNQGVAATEFALDTNNTEVRLANPLTFQVPSDWLTSYVTFDVRVDVDSLLDPLGPVSGDWTFDFQIPTIVGAVEVLVVDDDGTHADNNVTDALLRLGRPHHTHLKTLSGSPTPGDLLGYPIVIWHTGSNRPGLGGEFSTPDITALRSYLDSGGSLLLSTIDGIAELDALDPSFVTDYLQLDPGAEVFKQVFRGRDGNPIADGLRYQLSGNATGNHRILNPLGNAQTIFDMVDNATATASRGSIAVMNDAATHMTLVYGFGLEFASAVSGSFPLDTLIDRSIKALMGIDLTGGAPTPPILVAPRDSGLFPVFDLLPEIYWSEALDADPLSSVSYRLEVATDPAFTVEFEIDSIVDTSFTLIDSLAFGTQYWWRVTAVDNTGLETSSLGIDSFWTWSLGDFNHSHNTGLDDLSLLIDHLFISFGPIAPPFVGDVTGDCLISLPDLSAMIDHLFIGFASLAVGCEPVPPARDVSAQQTVGQ